MANRAARRREQRAGRMEKSPRSKAVGPGPVINVWAQEGKFVQQVALGNGYIAEMRLDLDLAENYVKECEGVLAELRTGIKVVDKSAGLITP